MSFGSEVASERCGYDFDAKTYNLDVKCSTNSEKYLKISYTTLINKIEFQSYEKSINMFSLCPSDSDISKYKMSSIYSSREG